LPRVAHFQKIRPILLPIAHPVSKQSTIGHLRRQAPAMLPTDRSPAAAARPFVMRRDQTALPWTHANVNAEG
jgi:hypothetical protein